MRRTRERWFRLSRTGELTAVVVCTALVNAAPAAGIPANNFPYPGGKALDERAAELDIEGRSDMTADEKRAGAAMEDRARR
jgi:hypothetical protein